MATTGSPLRDGQSVSLAGISPGRRIPDDIDVRVTCPEGAEVDLIAVVLAVDGKVSSDADLVFFNQPQAAGGAVVLDGTGGAIRIRPRRLAQGVDRVVVGCAEGMPGGLTGPVRVDVCHPQAGPLATASVDLPPRHPAGVVLDLARWGQGWQVRIRADGYPAGLEGLVRAYGVAVDRHATAEPVDVETTAVVSPVMRTPVASAPPEPAIAPVSDSRRTHRARRPLLIGAGSLTALFVLLLVIGALAGSPAPATQQPATSTSSSGTTRAVETSTAPVVLAGAQAVPVIATAVAQAQLALLPVKGRAPMTGYDRAAFGQSWADVDRNGCDTRNDVLRRDLVTTTVDPATMGCVVLTGMLADPYSGRTIAFVRGAGSADDVEIDHVVALGDAWQTGAQQLDPVRREQFANDPANLLAVDGGLNAQKGDGDAATWLPPNTSFRCTYAALQVSIKSSYGLWVTGAERGALAEILSRCPGATAPAPAAAPTTVPSASAAQVSPPPVADPPVESTPLPADGGGGVHYSNCTEARAAGAAPIVRGEPGYRTGLDRDDDGVACES